MHELSIALSIVEEAREEAWRQGGGRICAVHLRLGPLSGIVEEALCFSWDLVVEGTELAGSTLIVRKVPIRVFCETCGAEAAPVSEQCLHCAGCGSSNCHVIAGDELELAALELEVVEACK